MTITIDSPFYQPGKTRDVEVSQMYGVVMAGPRPPAYAADYVLQIATRWAHWSDLFGFLRSLTWGQGPGHETGWFWSRVNVNQVKPEQHNWGGLGADNSGAAGGTFKATDTLSAIDHGILAYMTHLSLYVHGTPDMWPEHTRQYAQYAYRLEAVKKAHNRTEKPDGTLLGYLGVVKTPGDFLNGRWAQTDDKPLGTLENGYAHGIVTKANETHAMPVDPAQPVPPAVPPKEQPMHVGIPGVPFVAADTRHHKPGRNEPWPYYLIQHHTDGFDSLNWLTTSPNSQVSATYLLRNDGTVRAQLVSHTDTPWTTGRMNDDSISCEWERYWTDPARRQFANGVPDSVYQNIGAFWAEVVRVERARGNPHFQGTPVKDQVRDHNDFYQTACPGNLDMNRVYAELVKALESDVTPDVPPAEPENPNAKFFEDTGHWIVNDAYDGVQVDMLDFYEREGGIIQIGLPLEGMHQDADGVYRQAMENAILEFWPHGFGNVTGPLYRFGRYLDHVDRLRDAA